MNFLFAWRYFKSKKTTTAINIIAWISILAITVGTAALIIILSVFNGFEDIVKNLYGDFYADIKVVPAKGKFTHFTPLQINNLKSTPGVLRFCFEVEEKAVLVNGDNQSIIYLRGVDENFPLINNVAKHIETGMFNVGTTDTPFVVLGSGIQNATGIDPSAPQTNLVLYLPNRTAKSFTGIDAMNSFNVIASGIFSVQEEFDNKYAFTNLSFVQYMLSLSLDDFSAVEIQVQNGSKIDEVKDAIQQKLGNTFNVQTRYEQNQSLFTIMEVEKWVIYAILSLILLIAAFNIIGALTMLVLEKQKDIAVLKAMGANKNLIQNIFLSEGLLLAVVGGFSGILIAFIICSLQLHYHLIKLEGGSFIINYYPVKMVPADFLLVASTVLIVALLASWIPSRKASTQFFSLKS